MRTRLPLLRGSVVALLGAALAVALASGEARADGSAGVEAGIAARSHEHIGPALGVHFELAWRDLYIGPYYMHESPYEAIGSEHRTVQFNSVGGRLRYAPKLANGLVSPFVTVGLGYARADYASFRQNPTLTSPSNSNVLGTIVSRNGSFAELPVGLGVGVLPIRTVQIYVAGYVRPGFAFGGSAYDDATLAPVERHPTVGLDAVLGASVEF